MIEVLKWLGAIEAIGLAAFPLAFAAFPALRDRGWGLAKPLGLLVVSFGVWSLSYAGLLPNEGWAYGLLTLVMAAGGALYMRRRWRSLRQFVRTEWKAILAGEALFLIFFALWVAYRAYDPAIAGTEKPMDFLFLNASIVAPGAPPGDPWLSGHSVSYYYFGYWMLGGLAQMAAVPAYIAFNLALALIAALSAGAIFSLVYGLVARDGGRRSAAILAGAAGAGLLLIAANLTGMWEGLASGGLGPRGLYEWLAIDGLDLNDSAAGWRSNDHWWWWRSSRVINSFDGGAGLDFTIQEFPFFSLLLGDLHPHLIGMPFLITGIAAAANLAIGRARWGLSWLLHRPASALVLVLLIGASGFINIWDLTLLAGLVTLAALVRGSAGTGGGFSIAAIKALLPVVLIVGAGLALFAPFYFGTFSSQVQFSEFFFEPLNRTIKLPPIGPAAVGTRPVHFLTVWGLLLLAAAPFSVFVLAPVVRRLARWSRGLFAEGAERPLPGSGPPIAGLALVLLAVTAPYLIWSVAHLTVNEGARPDDQLTRALVAGPIGVAAGLLAIGALVRARAGLADGATFILVAAAIALYLLYGAELLFIHDLFGNRMNTVFKLYYQAWIILAAVAAYGLHYWRVRHATLRGAARNVSRTAGILMAVLLAAALYYPVAAIDSKADRFRGKANLDGLAHISVLYDEERMAIEWLREQAVPGDTILEAVGGGYSEFGRVSSSTGIPTVLGWPGHEHQWRGTTKLFDGREDDVARIYETAEASEARALLEEYGVTYVYVGHRERATYSPIMLDKFEALGELAYPDAASEADSPMIFRITSTAAASPAAK